MEDFNFQGYMVMTLLFLLFGLTAYAINSIYDRMVKRKMHENGLEISEFYTEKLAEITKKHLEGIMEEAKEMLEKKKILNDQQIKAVNLVLNQCIQRSSSQHLIVNRKQKQRFKGPQKGNYKKSA